MCCIACSLLLIAVISHAHIQILVHASFTPSTVDRISTLLDIPKNFMFVSCPDDRFPHEIADFGGIRLITG